MVRITVAGTGYVGLVTGTCFADFGNEVLCLDSDENKIKKLESGEMPIFEPGLHDVVTRNVGMGRLSFTNNSERAVDFGEIIFIAVGTPPAEDGSADLSSVELVARTIGRYMNGYKVVVDKSTVPIGTARLVRRWIEEELEIRGIRLEFDVVSNPEFLREGTAVYDFMHPDRVVLGVESAKAAERMKEVYRVLYLSETPFIETGLESAEMIKYAANAFLAVKIAFINEVADLCEKVGANVKDVAAGVGRDGRIGQKFLHPGPGYGGSCFPKDTKAFSDIGRRQGSNMSIVEAAITSNDRHKNHMVEKIRDALGGLSGKVIAILGLAFKQNTDDMREAPALTIVSKLMKSEAYVKAYDPAAINEAKWRFSDFGDRISYCLDEYEAIKGSDAVVILTEWNQFRNIDLERAKKLMRGSVLCDFRNLYERSVAEKVGFKYFAVGR